MGASLAAWSRYRCCCRVHCVRQRLRRCMSSCVMAWRWVKLKLPQPVTRPALLELDQVVPSTRSPSECSKGGRVTNRPSMGNPSLLHQHCPETLLFVGSQSADNTSMPSPARPSDGASPRGSRRIGGLLGSGRSRSAIRFLSCWRRSPRVCEPAP